MLVVGNKAAHLIIITFLLADDIMKLNLKLNLSTGARTWPQKEITGDVFILLRQIVTLIWTAKLNQIQLYLCSTFHAK